MNAAKGTVKRFDTLCGLVIVDRFTRNAILQQLTFVAGEGGHVTTAATVSDGFVMMRQATTTFSQLSGPIWEHGKRYRCYRVYRFHTGTVYGLRYWGWGLVVARAVMACGHCCGPSKYRNPWYHWYRFFSVLLSDKTNTESVKKMT